MATSPQLAQAYLALIGLVGQTSLDEAEAQVALLAASFENRSPYDMAAHSLLAKRASFPDDVLGALRSGTPIRHAKFEALRRMAQALVATRGRPSEADLAAFLAAGYREQQLLEVVLAVGTKTISNYVNLVAATPLDRNMEAFAWRDAGETP
jgi:alkylhydroperoxidase family enzyme